MADNEIEPADPFTVCYNRLWNIFTDSTKSKLPDMVGYNNRVVLTGDDVRKKKISLHSADSPEFGIFPAPGGTAHIRRSSTGSVFIQMFVLELLTTDTEIDTDFFPIKWEMLRALTAAGPKLGLTFVELAEIRDVSDNQEQLSSRTGQGWSAVFNLSVQFSFKTADIIAGQIVLI